MAMMMMVKFRKNFSWAFKQDAISFLGHVHKLSVSFAWMMVKYNNAHPQCVACMASVI